MALWEQKAKTFIILIATLAMGAAACGEDADSSSGDLSGSEAPQIAATPFPLVFQQAIIGETVTEEVVIENNGSGTLRINEMSLEEENGAGHDQRREFARGDAGWESGTITIPQNGTHRVSVTYTPQNQQRDQGAIVIHSNDPDREEYRVNISTSDLAPDLYSPENVVFGRVPHRPNEPEWDGEFQITQVQNLGAAPLEISDVYVGSSDSRFRVTFPQPTDEEIEEGLEPDRANDTDQWPQTLAPDETFPVRVWFKPDDNLPESDELVFESNDGDEPQYVVNLTGNSGAACIQVSPSDEVDFGQASLGQVTQKTITIENCSRSSDLTVGDIQITDDGGGAYAIQDGSLPGALEEEDEDAVISPGERTNFVVTFEPTTEDEYTGELVIESDDSANSTMTLPIRGRGSDNICPTADAKAWIQGTSHTNRSLETIPLNTIMFDGSDSEDEDGSIDRYEWTILSRPQGSTQRMLPDASSANPRLFLDLAGTYEVELKVYDDEGAASCGEPTIITIVAVPEDDVHIQLVWDTPSDTDQEDTDGTDLDLHYLHPNGEWDEAPWDIFWQNKSADWGTRGNSSDDPSLDIDDTDGAGPENINHSGLENLTYRAGVYYYSDATLGASYATLRVYVDGALSVELENQYMPRTGSFWDAVFIEWPSGNVTNISRMYDGFPGNP